MSEQGSHEDDGNNSQGAVLPYTYTTVCACECSQNTFPLCEPRVSMSLPQFPCRPGCPRGSLPTTLPTGRGPPRRRHRQPPRHRSPPAGPRRRRRRLLPARTRPRAPSRTTRPTTVTPRARPRPRSAGTMTLADRTAPTTRRT